MKDQFVTYEIALKLKELGFDEECFAYYLDKKFYLERLGKIKNNKQLILSYKKHTTNHISAPLWQQTMNWFREEMLIEILILPQDKSGCAPTPLYFIAIWSYEGEQITELFNSTAKLNLLHYGEYREAREQAILKAIALCQNKK